jgi:hypothetical protein
MRTQNHRAHVRAQGVAQGRTMTPHAA